MRQTISSSVEVQYDPVLNMGTCSVISKASVSRIEETNRRSGF